MKYFKREELACNCGCGQDTVDYQLAQMLDQIREWAGAPVTVTSGNRCPAYNESVGGSPKSQHLLGRAADIVVQGKTPAEVAAFAETLSPGGLGQYLTFTHIDSRSGHARWGTQL